MASYQLGIDYGTGGAKACIIDEEANVVSYAFREYPIIVNKEGWSEHDPVLYWEVTCTLIKECLAKGNVDPRDIKGIGTSSACPSTVMVDKYHEPVNLAYNLLDLRATKEVKWLQENIGEKKLFELTGNRLEDHPLIVNLMWEKANRRESYEKIDQILTIDGFIRLKLTGKSTVNFSNAAYYGVAYDIIKNKFDEEILSAIGIPLDKLPEAFQCEEIIGQVTKKAAAETGLVEGIPVVAGQTDCNAGWMGAGAIEVGDMQMNLGTCGNFGIVIPEVSNLHDALAYSAYSLKDTYIVGAGTSTGGQSLRYLRDNFSQLEVAVENLAGINAYELLDREAERVGIGSEGLIILPYLMGERSPIWDEEARGVIFGLSLNHHKCHVVRAMMEGVAYALYDSFCVVKDIGIKVKYPIVLNEGGAKSKIWRRIITDVFNVPTVLTKSRVGAPFGDAILSGVATGMFKDYSITKEKAEYIDLMEPNEKNYEIYMEYFKLYKDIYSHLKNDFQKLAELRRSE